MDYPFLSAVKQAFDQASGKSGGTVFWRLDAYVKGKAQLVHNNSLIGDAAQSWKLLETNLTNQYRWGGVRQFDVHFRESNNDSQPKLFPLDLTNEQAVNALAGRSVGIAGIGNIPGMEALGITGIGSILQLVEAKHAAELSRREQELNHKHAMEKLLLEIKAKRSGNDRIGEAVERLLDKPGFGEKLLDKLFPEPAQVAGGGGSAASDNLAAADDGIDFNGIIEGEMRRAGVQAADWGLDYNKGIEAMLVLKSVPGVSDPGQLLKGVAEFVKSNPVQAMQIFAEIQNQQSATA